VAELAGVSKSTVSNVVRGRSTVAPQLRLRVEQAVAELGYTPSAVARSLVTRRTDTLGAIVPDLGHPFYADLLRGAERQCVARGFSLIMATTEGRVRDEQKTVESLVAHRCDGYVLCGFSDWSVLAWLEARGMPVAIVDTPTRAAGAAAITVDDHLGALLATQHLIELGHTRIVSVLDSETVTERSRRVAGYVRALDEAGIPLDPALLLRDRRPPGAREPAPRPTLAAQILALEPQPTAVVCGDDMVAIGLMDALEARGFHVPLDISLTGFDDDPLAGVRRIGLTTVRQPAMQMGELAAAVLVDHLRGDDPRDLGSVAELLEPELVIRRSTSPPPEPPEEP
jgi:LacI family transcriptional regulator